MMNRDTENLEARLAGIGRDEAYRVVAVLKASGRGRTEQVQAADGTFYLRKYAPLDASGPVREYQILSGLAHPGLPRIHDYYELADMGVIIEEFIEGVRLSDQIAASGRLAPWHAVGIALQLCDACHYLHTAGPTPIIHRDIKPDNIICTPDGTVKLVDFGAARAYRAGGERDTVYMGTVGYAPPEQFGFGQTDVRADIYGIGMTLLHMLTGEAPERGRDPHPPAGDIAPELGRVIATATRFDPAQRHPSAAALRDDLAGAGAGHGPADAQAPTLFERLMKRPNSLYPKHLDWPVGLKLLLMPLHAFLFMLFVAVMIGRLASPSGFGLTDDMLIIATDLVILGGILFAPYALFLNLWDLDRRIPFFHRYRLLKKVLVALAMFVAANLLLVLLGSLHSEAYKLAHLASS